MKSLSISQKLIISLIIISLLPYAAISYINYSMEKSQLEKSIFEDLTALAEAKSTHISTVINFRIEQVKEISTSNFMQEIEHQNNSNLNINLLRVKREIPEFLEISALDINGKVITSTDRSLIHADYSREEFFKQARETLYLGDIDHYFNRTAYVVSYPVLNKSTGRFIGVIVARIYPRFIYDVTGDYTGMGKSGEALLVQKRGDEIIFLNPLRYDPEAALRLRFPLNSSFAVPAILAATGEKGAVRALDYRGQEVFAAYTSTSTGKWGLVVKIDSSEALVPAINLRDRSIGLGIFYFIVVAALAFLMGKRLTRPLIRLSNASKKVAKGYLTVQIEPESHDEIGELALSFNVMVKKLKDLYEGLENKVKERTAILNQKNLELAALIKTNQSISSGLDLEKVLNIAVREAARIINVSYCSIILIEKGEDFGKVASEYSSIKNLGTSPGEILSLKDCPILNEVYLEKHYVLVPDTRKAELSAKEKEISERLDIKSILIMPLVLGEKSLGAIHLGSIGELKDFSEEEISISGTIANQVGIAIENAHLYSQLKKHDATLEALFEIDRVVSQSLYLEELLKEAIAKTIQVTSSDAGWIYLLEEDGETLTLKTHMGISEELAQVASRLKVGRGVSGMAVKSGKPITMDIENYPYTDFLPLMVKDGITSLVGIPLIVKGKTKGAMVLSNRKRRIFSGEDIELLSSIGSQIGVAVENARLYSELKHHDRTLETLFEIDRVVSQSLDIDEIFKEALVKTIQVTASDAGAIYIIEEDGKKLRLKTSFGISENFIQKVTELKIGEGIAGGAARTKRPFITDIDHYPSHELLPFLEKEGLLALAGTPLMAKGKVVGAMNLGNRSKRIFSKDDIEVLASIGGQIGVAVENARLYQEVRASYEKLQSAYNELKSLDRMKSEFLSNVSHELKTPLVSIRGYSELMYDDKLGIINPSQNKALEAIIRNTDRLIRLIDSLLFLSMQQMGKPDLKMKRQPLLVDEIITASISDMKVQAEKKNITMLRDVSNKLQVLADRDRLMEVFLNLIDNALKFTNPGGSISIKAQEEMEKVHISVADTGVGIPEDVVPFLFQRFYQADASLTRKYGGAGLGLYICKNIIDAHNGEIWVESKLGAGTTVHVRLPKTG